MKDFSKAETKVDTSDAECVHTEDRGYTPATSRVYGASETGSSAKLGGSGSFGNKSRHRVKGGLIGVVLSVMLAVTAFAAPFVVFADSTNNAEDSFTDNITYPGNERAVDDSKAGTWKTVPNTSSGSAQGVHQSEDSTSPFLTFGSAMPLSTIYVDTNMLTGGTFGTFAWESTSLDPGFVLNTAGEPIFDPSQTGSSQLTTETAGAQGNYFSGPLYSYTYQGAAELFDGTKANIKITYSNLHIYVDERIGSTGTFDYSVNLPKENDITTKNSDTTYGDIDDDPTYGKVFARMTNAVVIDARVQIVDDSGNPIEGTFIFPMQGINIFRGNTRVGRTTYLAAENNYFSEGIRVNSGTVSDIYIRSKNAKEPGETYAGFFPRVTNEAAGVYEGAVRFDAVSRLIANGNRNGHNTSYQTGFVTTADAAKGISVTGQTVGAQGALIDTYLAVGKVMWHRIRSVTGPGGNIQTTTEANYGGNLSDGGDILGPGTYVVPDGKTVVYTMKPDKGYVLNELRINDNITNIPTLITGVAKMEPGDTKTVSLASGKTGKITKFADGSYTFDFPENNNDHTIMVTWIPETADVTVAATKKWYDKDNAFDKRKDIVLHVNGKADYGSGEAYNYPTNFLPAQKMQAGTVADDNDDWVAKWGDGEKNNHAYSGVEPAEQVVAKVSDLPPDDGTNTYFYFYDYSLRKFRAYTYNTVSGEFIKTDNVHWVNFLPRYDESGKMITYTVDEEVPEGYSLNVTTNNNGQASQTMADFDYTLKNTLESVGTVKVKANKVLDGRAFNGNDEFVFVLAGEDGAPMPVGTAVKLPADGEDTPEKVVQTITPTVDTVSADADFGVISYRKSDLKATDVVYSTVSEEKKEGVRFWTVKNAPKTVDNTDRRGFIIYKQGETEFYYDKTNNKLYDAQGAEVNPFDLDNYTKSTTTVNEDRVFDMLDSVDIADFNALDASIRDTATGKTYERIFSYTVTENPKHPTYVENDTATHQMKVRVFYNEKESKIYIDDEDVEIARSGVQDITAEKPAQLSSPEVTLHRTYFTNKYDNKTKWTPEVVKLLNGRPISEGQFKDYFTIKAVDTAESINAQVTNKILAGETPMPGNVSGVTATSTSQEIQTATAAPKGIDNLKGIVGFDSITYTNDDLKKEISYDGASDDQKKQVIHWEKGSTMYGPIPGDATATVHLANGSTGSVTYDEATEAQRKEVETTGWASGGKTYIDTSVMSATDAATALAGSTGTYYLSERKFTYKVWESKTPGSGYIADQDHDTEGEAYEVIVTVKRNDDGTITATANKTVDQLKFENKYTAAGDAYIKVTKKMDGRDEFGSETFPAGSKVKFTISAVTDNTPLPTDGGVASNDVEVALPAGERSYTLTDTQAFPIKFTQVNLMNDAGTEYIAARNKEGLYERTLIYKITETVTAGNGTKPESTTEGLQPGTNPKDATDQRDSILVAVTIQEDNEGNIKVVAVNGADKATLDSNTEYSNQDIAIEKYDPAAGTWNSNTSKMDPVAVSYVKAGTIYNTYQAAGNAEITAKKVLEGGNLKANQFYYELIGKIRDKNNAVINNYVLDAQPNDANGDIKFQKLVYNLNDVQADVTAGIAAKTNTNNIDYYTYIYKVKEIIPDDSTKAKGYTYATDPANNELEVKVTLKDDGKGNLTVDKTEWTGNKDTIKNKYEATGEAPIEGTKMLNGRTLAADEFSFTVTPGNVYKSNGTTEVTGPTPPAPVDASNNTVATVKNAADGSIDFGTVKFTMDDLKTETTTAGVTTVTYDKKRVFTYKLKETRHNDDSITTWDLVERTVKVTVEDMGDGTLKVTPAFDAISGVSDSSVWTNAVELIDITVTKTWYGVATDDVKVTMQQNNGTLTANWENVSFEGKDWTHTFKAGEFTTDGKKDATYKFEGLQKFDSSGKQIEYRVHEDAAPSGANYEIAQNDAESDKSYTVINVNRETIDVEATKIWNDNNNQDGKRVDAKFTLTNDGNDFNSGDLPSGTTAEQTVAVPASGDAATATWTVYKYLYKNDNGSITFSKPTYKIKETTIPTGYTASPASTSETESGLVDAGGTITNSYTPETASILVTKKWDDNSNQQGNRPKDPSKVYLYKKVWNGTEYGAETLVAVDPVAIPTGTDTTAVPASATKTWDKLPVYENGKKIQYIVKEENIAGYTPTYKHNAGTAGTNYDASGTSADQIVLIKDQTGPVEITNKETLTTGNIRAEKIWDDADNQDGKRPTSVEFTLYDKSSGTNVKVEKDADGNAIDNPVTLDGTADSSTANGRETEAWKAEWTKLPEYVSGKTGTPAKYVIVETYDSTALETNGYTRPVVTYGGTESEGFFGFKKIDVVKVTNSYVPELTSVNAEKNWVDNDNHDGIRPNFIVLTLQESHWVKGSGGNPGSWSAVADVDPARTLTLTNADSENNWTGSIDRLPKYMNGKAVKYSFTEKTVPADYTKTETTTEATGTAVAKTTVTNTHGKFVGTVEVTKIWEDQDNKYNKRPSTDEFKNMIQLKDDDGNKAKDADGNVVEPTVTQATGNANKNKYVVKWENVLVYKADGRSSGDKIVYSIEETDLNAGYEIVGQLPKNIKLTRGTNNIWSAQGGITLTNKLTTLDLPLRKIWIDYDVDETSADTLENIRPASVTLRVTADIEMKNATGTALAGWTVSNGSSYTDVELKAADKIDDSGIRTGAVWYKLDDKLKDLPMYKADGTTAITYTISEPSVPANYEQKNALTNETNAIVNVYKGVEFIGTKVWKDGKEHNSAKELDGKLVLHRDWTPAGGTLQTETVDNFHIDWSDDNFEIIGLPKKTVNGDTYTYWLSEDVPAGYKVKYSVQTHGSTGAEDGIKSGGTITNTLKVGDATIAKKFVDKSGNLIPKAQLPAGFKIKVKYVTVNAQGEVENTTVDLTIGDKTPETSGDYEGFYKWTVENVASRSTLSAEEYSYQKPTGYIYDSTTVEIKGEDGVEHPDVNPNYAEVVMPAGAATRNTITVDDKASIAFTNVYDTATQDLWVSKKWTDQNDADGIRPDKVTLTIRATDSENQLIEVLPNKTAGGNKVSERDIDIEDADNTGGSVWTDRTTFVDLPIYDSKGGKINYLLTEKTTEVPVGYTKSADVNTTLTEDSVSNPCITNTHTPEKAEVNVTKTWNDESNSAGLRQPTTVYLYKQVYSGTSYGTATLVGKIVEGKIKIADSNNVEVDWSDLPVIENGKPIRYSVKENAVKHYTTTVKYKNDSATVTTGTDEDSYLELGYLDADEQSTTYGQVIKTDGTAEITNKYDPGSRGLEVTKKWDDADNVDGKRPETITVKIKAEFADGTEAKVFGQGSSKSGTKEITLGIDSTADIAKKFTVVDSNKWKWTYEPKEIEDPNNPGSMISNTDYSGFDLPEYVDDDGKATTTDPAGTNGREVFYYIEEEAVSDYTTVITRTAPGKYEITNSYKPETTSAEITKVWEDNSDATGLRPNTLTMELWRTYDKLDGTKAYEKVSKDADNKDIKTLISEDDKKGSDKNTWEYKVDNLPKNILLTNTTSGEKVSKPITYYWKETVPTNYRAERTGADPTPGETVASTICKAENGEKITNTLTTFKLNVEKVWADGDNRDDVRPASVSLTLEKTTDDPAAATASWTTVTIPAGTITNPIPNNNNKDGSIDLGSMTLPAYEDGNLVHYRLTEDNTSLATNNYTITHTVTGVTGSAAGNEVVFDYDNNTSGLNKTTSIQFRNEHTTTFTVTKKWVDKEGNTVRPSANDYADWLVLYAGNDPAVDGSGQALKPTVTANTDGTYTATWTNLPSYSGSNLIVYTAVEKNGSANKIPGYDTPVYTNVDTSKTDKAYDKGVITNKQLIKVNVVKEWNDNNNHDGQRPGKIKVTLYRNGVQYGAEKTLTEATATKGTSAAGNDTWTWSGDNTWKDLPYVDANGSVYNYTATETGLGDSTGLWGILTNERTIRQILLNSWNDAKDTLTFNVTNTDDEDKIGFTVDKIWDDANDADDLRPEKIYYKLYKKIGTGGTEEYMQTLPTGATVKTSSNTDDTVRNANYDTNGYVEVNANKGDVTQGTLNRVIFDGLPKYERVNKGTQTNPDWETVEIFYTIKEDADPATAAIDPIPGYNLNGTDQMPTISGDHRVGMTVTNDHTPVTSNVSASFKKMLTGREFRSTDKFKFLIEPKDDGPRPAKDYVTVTNVASGHETTVSVPAIKITGDDINNGGTAVTLAELIENPDGSTNEKSEKFTYELSEVYGGKTIDDVTFDDSKLTLEVTVKWDAATKALVTTQTWKKGTQTVTGDNISFTNRYGKVGTLTLRKAWIDRDADETSIVKRPDSVKIRVTADKKPADTGWTEDTSATPSTFYKDYTLDKNDADTTKETDDVWKKETEQLPKTDENGESITYTVSEPDVPENYEQNPAIISVLDVYTVINKYETIELEGTKQWIDGGKAHNNPTEVKLTVHWITNAGTTTEATGTFDISPDDAHIDWDKTNKDKFKVIGLPKYDEDGNEYSYWITEEQVSGYDVPVYDNSNAKAQGDRSKTDALYDGGKVKNTIKQEPVEIDGDKKWIGGEDSEHVNTTLNLTLYRRSAKSGSSIESGNDIKKVENTGTTPDPVWEVGTVAASETWDKGDQSTGDDTYKFSDLPKYDAEGYEYTYWVVEASVPDNYTASYSNDVDELNVTDKAYDDGIITNTSNKTDDLKVTKEWDDKDASGKEDAEGLRPTEVTVHLYKMDGTNQISAGQDEKVLNTANNWTATWTNLPVYDADGTKIEYVVVEEAVSGYTTTYDPADNKTKLDGNTGAQEVKIKNALTPAVTKVTVEKIWDDNDNIDGKRPTSVEIKLYERVWNKTSKAYNDEAAAKYVDGTAVPALTLDGTADGGTENVKETAAWKGEFDKLAQTKNGKTVIYYVKETPIVAEAGYKTAVVQGNQLDGFKVTNTREKDKTSATITKVWVDNDNVLDTRPDTLTMTLMRKYTDENGDVQHEAVDKDIYNNAVKSHMSDDDVDGTNTNKWTATINNLPKSRLVGTAPNQTPAEYTYYWKETIPTGYTAASSKDTSGNTSLTEAEIAADNGETITNAYKTGKITVVKTWDDRNDVDKKREAALAKYESQLTLFADDTKVTVGSTTGITQSKAVTSGNTTTIVFDNLPIYDKGTQITYTVDEGDIPEYELTAGPTTSKIDDTTGVGLNITLTNKHEIETVDMPVRVSWVNDKDALDGTTAATSGLTDDRPTEITVTLQMKDENGKWVDVTTKADGTTIPSSITLDSGDEIDGDPNNWGDLDTWSGLAKNGADGKPIKYRIIQSGYETVDETVAPSKASSDNGDKGIDGETVAKGSTMPARISGYMTVPVEFPVSGNLTTFVNTYETTTITGTKVWVDPNPDKHNNSADIKFKVERREPGASTWTTLKEDTDYHVDWSTVSKKDDTFKIRGLTKYVDPNATDKVAYEYRVTEIVPDGYDAVYPNTTTAGTGYLDKNGGEIKNIIKQDYVKIDVTKKWVGHPVKDVEVELLADGKKVAEHEFKVSDFTTPDKKVTYTFTRDNGTGVKKGYEKYDLDPNSANYGKEIVYTANETTSGDFTTTYSDDKLTITNNSTEKITVEAIKKWEGDNDAKDRRDDVEFKLIQTIDGASKPVADYTTQVDGRDVDVTGTQTIPADKSVKAGEEAGRVTWPNLPVTDSNGNDITYTVEEIAAPEGYSMSGPTGIGTKADPFVITNTLEKDTINVPVMVKWDDSDDNDGIRPSSTEVVLEYYDVETDEWKAYTVDGYKANMTLDESNNWKYLFKDLPKTDKNGKPIEYKVVETRTDVLTGDDTATTYDIEEVGDSKNPAAGFKITNIHSVDKRIIEATKVWDDDDDAAGLRDDVILHLYGMYDGLIVYDGGTKKIAKDASGDDLTVIWKNIPAKHYDNDKLEWKIVEEPLFGYTTEITGNAEDGFEILNTYVGPVENIKVTKEWDDANDAAGKRPAKITYILWQKIGDEEPTKYKTKTVDVDSNTGEAEYEWTGLPVTENKVVDTTSETRIEYVDGEKQATDASGNLAYEEIASGIIIYVDPASKSTYDQDANYKPLMEQVAKEVEDTIEVTEEVPILYCVTEEYESADEKLNLKKLGYDEPQVEAVAPGEFNVINRRDVPKTSVAVKKVWNDNNDEVGVRPDHVDFILKADGEQIAIERVDAEDEWKYTFDNLDKTDAAGNTIKYTVEEKPVPDYTTVGPTGDGSEDNPYVFTNTYNVKTINLKAIKKWAGDEDNKDKRKDVTFNLVKVVDGESSVVEGKEKVVKADKDAKAGADAGSVEWANLPTKENGKDVSYTVQEDVVAGYKTSISDVKRKSGDNFEVVVTNDYNEQPQPIENLRGDVIYIDPMNGKGKMILRSDSYDTYDLAGEAARAEKNKPADPSHKGVKFLGWNLNYDENGNYVLVAMYSDIPTKFTPVTSYIDPQSGLLISEETNDPMSVIPPSDPKYPNLVFKGWKKIKDAAGNTIYVAEYGCECSNGTPKSVDKSNVNTGDETMIYVWLWILLLSAASLVMTAIIRNRSFERTDGYKPKH